jgi:hypothetical protein
VSITETTQVVGLSEANMKTRLSRARLQIRDARGFQISCAITWLLGGIFLEVVGTRLGLALAVCFWSG